MYVTLFHVHDACRSPRSVVSCFHARDSVLGRAPGLSAPSCRTSMLVIPCRPCERHMLVSCSGTDSPFCRRAPTCSCFQARVCCGESTLGSSSFQVQSQPGLERVPALVIALERLSEDKGEDKGQGESDAFELTVDATDGLVAVVSDLPHPLRRDAARLLR